MKTRFSFAGLIAAAFAGEDIGPWTYSKKAKLVLYENGGTTGTTPTSVPSTITWTLYTYSAFDEDAGIEYFRLQHELDAQIKGTDTVTFEIAFTSGSQYVTNKKVIAEDSAVCTMVRNVQTANFWTQTPTDHYYTTDKFDNVWLGIGASTTWVKGTDSGTGNDWTAPWKDDDEFNPFCTPNSNDSADIFVCKKIKCLIQREMVTGDNNDFTFSTEKGKNYIMIAPGRALLGINDQAISSGAW